jgi:hypothetical protein
MDDTAENWVLTISQLAIFEGRPKTDVVRLISVKSPFDIPPAAFFLLSPQIWSLIPLRLVLET